MKVCICILGMFVASVSCGSIFAASSFKSGIDFDHGFSKQISHDGIKTVTKSYKSLDDFSSLGVHKKYVAAFGSGKPIVEITDDQTGGVDHGSQDVNFIKLGLTKGDSGTVTGSNGGSSVQSGFNGNHHVTTSGASSSGAQDIQTIRVIHVENGHNNYDGLAHKYNDFESYGANAGRYSNLNGFDGHQELIGGLQHYGPYGAPKGIGGTDDIQKFKIIRVVHHGYDNNDFKGYSGSFAKHADFNGNEKTFSGYGSIGDPEDIKTIKIIHSVGSSQLFSPAQNGYERRELLPTRGV